MLKNELITEIYPLHDSEALKHMETEWYGSLIGSQVITRVRDYFGTAKSHNGYGVELKDCRFPTDDHLNLSFNFCVHIFPLHGDLSSHDASFWMRPLPFLNTK